MNNEEFTLILKDLLIQLTNSIRLQNKQAEFYEGLLKRGLIFEKKVSKFAKSSGAIYCPRRLIGRSFQVVLVPIDEENQLFELPKKEGKKDLEKVNENIEIAGVKKDMEMRKSLI